MKPTSESTALEGAEGFVEYVAAGKLKGKKALITGGEYGSRLSSKEYSLDDKRDPYSPPVISAFFPFSFPAATYSTKPSAPSSAVDSLVGFIACSVLGEALCQ